MRKRSRGLNDSVPHVKSAMWLCIRCRKTNANWLALEAVNQPQNITGLWFSPCTLTFSIDLLDLQSPVMQKFHKIIWHLHQLVLMQIQAITLPLPSPQRSLAQARWHHWIMAFCLYFSRNMQRVKRTYRLSKQITVLYAGFIANEI